MAKNDKLKMVKVRGTGDDCKVVLYERNEQHPGGQAFVANNGKVVQVAETPAVKTAIAEGRLTLESASEEPRRVGRPPKQEQE